MRFIALDNAAEQAAADHSTILELHEVTLIDPKPAKIQETAFVIRQWAAMRSDNFSTTGSCNSR